MNNLHDLMTQQTISVHQPIRALQQRMCTHPSSARSLPSAAPEPSPPPPHRAHSQARATSIPGRSRQRSHLLTKTELNQMRRKRLKSVARP